MTLEDSQKNRKISNIEKKLEYFYYPLKKLFNPTLFFDDSTEDIYSYQYLATEETKKCFLRFIDPKLNQLEQKAVANELRDLIESDIKDLLNKLNELLN